MGFFLGARIGVAVCNCVGLIVNFKGIIDRFGCSERRFLSNCGQVHDGSDVKRIINSHTQTHSLAQKIVAVASVIISNFL